MIIGLIVTSVSWGVKGVHGYKLHGLVWTDFPTHGFPSVPLTQTNYLVFVPPAQATEHSPQFFISIQYESLLLTLPYPNLELASHPLGSRWG